MQIGVISDVHANQPALDAVLDAMPPVDELVCAGDIVGYNPWPRECVDTMLARDIESVMGNHDRAVVRDTGFAFNAMAAAGVEYANETLDAHHRDWLAARPDSVTVANGRVAVFHGHPDDPDRYTKPASFSPAILDSAKKRTGDDRIEVVVLGHTHVQAVREFSDGIVLNPGSVGQPRDGDPNAAFAVVDIDDRTVTEERVPYDIRYVQDEIRRAGLPDRTATRLANGK